MKKVINKKLDYAIYGFLILYSITGLEGCAKKVKPDESSVPNSASSAPGPNAAEENMSGDSDSQKAMGLKTIHFGYDSEVLDTQAKSELGENAKILREKTDLKIQIEGHCDQRGGIQYNVALGERRAKAVKHYLMDLGIEEARLSVISYGKEHLLDVAETEEAYVKNRRANFVITSRI